MSKSLRILLLGGTDFTLAVAEHLWCHSHGLVGVVHVPSQFKVSYSASDVSNVRHVDLQRWCDERDIPSSAYESMDGVRDLTREVGADFALAVGWYHMIPRRIRELFPHGCAGVHASLLPQLRGGAPLNWAILTGKTETGVTLFELSDGVDDGEVYAQRSFAIGGRTDIGELVQRSRDATFDMLDEVIPGIVEGSVTLKPQSGNPSYCLQRTPDDGRIDWHRPAVDIARLVRAVSRPYPGAFTRLEGECIRIWRARPLAGRVTIHGAPGQIARIPECNAPCVVCGDDALAVESATTEDGVDVMETLLKAGNRHFT